MKELWCSRFQDSGDRVSDMYVPILKSRSARCCGRADGAAGDPARTDDEAKHFVLILLYHCLNGSAPNWERQQ